jgi:hypothetical protein
LIRHSHLGPALAVALLSNSLIATGCGTPATPSPVATAPSAPSVVPGSPIETTAPSLNPASPGLTVAADPSLLSRLPATVARITLAFDPETTASVAAEPGLGRELSSLAIAIAVAPASSSASGAGSGDLVVASVIRAREDPISDGWFRNWRDSYDEAACASAGGVSGHAQATMHERTVFIGSCAGGALTYHVRLAGEPIVVSATSVGPMRLGEKLMESIP